MTYNNCACGKIELTNCQYLPCFHQNIHVESIYMEWNLNKSPLLNIVKSTIQFILKTIHNQIQNHNNG